MFCVKCGVALADSEKVCPLCGTRVFHPDLPQPQGDPLRHRPLQSQKGSGQQPGGGGQGVLHGPAHCFSGDWASRTEMRKALRPARAWSISME